MSSKAEQDALKELDILALNQEINADTTGWELPNPYKYVQNKIGEFMTTTMDPHGYKGAYNVHTGDFDNKLDESLDILGYASSPENTDPEYLEEVSKGVVKKGGPREFPFRKGFGLEARDNWDLIYKKNENDSYSFKSVDELALLYDNKEITKYQFKEGLENIAEIGYGSEDGYHPNLMGSYEATELLPSTSLKPYAIAPGVSQVGVISYYDKWDFALNEGEPGVWSRSKDFISSLPSVGEFIGATELNEGRELLNDRHRNELLTTLGRKGVSMFQDPIIFEGNVDGDEIQYAVDVLELLDPSAKERLRHRFK